DRALPVGVRELCELDRDRVRLRARAGAARQHRAAFAARGVDATGTRVRAAATEAARVALEHALQCFDPALAPPGGARLLDLDAVLARGLLRRRAELAPVLPAGSPVVVRSAHGRAPLAPARL